MREQTQEKPEDVQVRLKPILGIAGGIIIVAYIALVAGIYAPPPVGI